MENLLCEGLAQVMQLSKRNLERIHYGLTSFELPLCFAMCFSSIIAVVDCISYGFPSPLLFAPAIVGITLAYFVKSRFRCSSDKEGFGIEFESRTPVPGLSLATVGATPLIYIIIADHILKMRTPWAAKACVNLPPAFMAVVCSTSVSAAAKFLGVHFILVTPLLGEAKHGEVSFGTPMSDFYCLLCNDILLLFAAWVKGQLISIVSELLSQYEVVDAYMLELNAGRKEGTPVPVHPASMPPMPPLGSGACFGSGAIADTASRDGAGIVPPSPAVDLNDSGPPASAGLPEERLASQSDPAPARGPDLETGSQGRQPWALGEMPPSSVGEGWYMARHEYGGVPNQAASAGTFADPMVRWSLVSRMLQEAEDKSMRSEMNEQRLAEQLLQQSEQLAWVLERLPPGILARLQQSAGRPRHRHAWEEPMRAQGGGGGTSAWGPSRGGGPRRGQSGTVARTPAS
jgi:hypothetical protein